MNNGDKYRTVEWSSRVRLQPWFAAHYSEVPIPAYQGNPLIETLPPIQSHKEMLKQLQCLPVYDNAQRLLPASERLHLLATVPDFFQPFLQHLELADTMSSMIRSGYVGRNPVQPGYLPRARAKLPSVLEYRPALAYVPLTVPGLTLMGVSGVGKTRSIYQVLLLHPQVIVHSHYRGKPFSCMQLVYLQISCPHDGSRKGLCLQFFRAVDQCLGTSYSERYSSNTRQSVDSLLLHMANVCILHQIGVLVIDEIQNLREATAQDAAKMLNFFTQLDNEIKVPVVLIGTPRARSILTGGFRRARRAEGQGGFIWERMTFDRTWDRFLKTLWRYQYTRNECKFTTALSRAIWDESQGVADIAIKLYCLTQARVIARGKGEHITVAAIQATARERLRFVRQFLTALRENDYRRLESDPTFDDLFIPMDMTVDWATSGSSQGRADDQWSSDAESPDTRLPDEHSSVRHETSPAADDTVGGDKSTTTEQEGLTTPDCAELGAHQLDTKSTQVVASTAGKRKKSSAVAPRVAAKDSLLHIFDTRRKDVAPYTVLHNAGYIRSSAEYLDDELEGEAVSKSK